MHIAAPAAEYLTVRQVATPLQASIRQHLAVSVLSIELRKEHRLLITRHGLAVDLPPKYSKMKVISCF